jgi:hypothetical protein
MATGAHAQQWAEQFGQTGVVVVDPGFQVEETWYPFGIPQGGNNFGFSLPGIALLSPGLKIETLTAPSDAQIQAALPG